jgi:hypothetical protein
MGVLLSQASSFGEDLVSYVLQTRLLFGKFIDQVPWSTSKTKILTVTPLMVMSPSFTKLILVLSLDLWFDRFRTFTRRNWGSINFPILCLKCVLLIRQGRDQVHGFCWWKNTNKTKTLFIHFYP